MIYHDLYKSTRVHEDIRPCDAKRKKMELWTAVWGLLALISRAYHNFSLWCPRVCKGWHEHSTCGFELMRPIPTRLCHCYTYMYCWLHHNLGVLSSSLVGRGSHWCLPVLIADVFAGRSTVESGEATCSEETEDATHGYFEPQEVRQNFDRITTVSLYVSVHWLGKIIMFLGKTLLGGVGIIDTC